MFHDLCVQLSASSGDADARECLAALLQLGYAVAALSRRPAVEGRITDADRCPATRVPEALLSAAGPEHASMLTMAQWDGLAQTAGSSSDPDRLTSTSNPPSQRTALRQLSRLTFRAAEAVQCEALASNSSITSGYDLLAVEPTTERVLQQACTSLDIEIITLNAGERLPFKLRPATLRPALLRGVMFEVCYAPALESSASRVMFVSNVQALAHCTRGRNIIVSSGCSEGTHLRSPHAVSCLLASMLGVPAQEASAALSSNAAAAVAKGAARRARAALGLPGTAAVVPGVAAGKKVQAAVGYTPRQDLPRVPLVVKKAVEDKQPGASLSKKRAR